MRRPDAEELYDLAYNVLDSAKSPSSHGGDTTEGWRKKLLDLAEGMKHVVNYALALEAAWDAVLEFWSDTEQRSENAHAVYQEEAHRRGDVRHADTYDDLDELTKEWDRVLIRWVLWATRSAFDAAMARAEETP